MVNRLQELAEEARIKPMGNSWAYRVFDEFEEEYGRLIVQECARIADNAEPYKANDLILKHFGIEK